MSGKCTGWVGEFGPHPEHLDRDGKKYGARARGLRMVLLAVADAANADGMHAHPGVAGVVRFSLYSAGQARRLLDELEAEGWLIVTEQGGGRAPGKRHGRATVYQVPMGVDDHPVLSRRASCAPSSLANARMADVDTRAPAADTRASAADTRASGCAPNGVPNGVPNGGDNGAAPQAPGDAAPSADQARLVAQQVWEGRTPRPAVPFIGIVKIAAALLDAGHAPEAIIDAMLTVPTISVRWVEAEINRRRPPQRSERIDVDRAAPSGEVAL